MPHIPKLDLFLEVNRQQIKDLSRKLGKDIGLQDKRQIKGFRLLLCNMFVQGQRQVMVSRRKQSLGGKKYNPFGIGYREIISSLDALQKNGYIIQEKGSHNEGTMTTMESTDKLIQWFNDTGWSDDRIDKRVGSYVTLRESRKQNDNAVYIDFDDTKYSKWLGERIRQYDQLLSSCRILLSDEDSGLKKFTIQRQFINQPSAFHNMEFAFGGDISSPWTDLPANLRKNITINDEATIELNRNASSLNAMYQVITGAPYPAKDDPYDVSVDGAVVPRHIVKNFAFFMQSSRSTKGAAHTIVNHYKREALEVKEPKDIDIQQYEEYVEFKYRVKTADIAQAILDKHPKIADHYNRGKTYGDFISGWESDIIFEVVMELTKKDIPCLVIQDSFIVPIQYKDLLDSVKDTTPYIDRKDLHEGAFKDRWQ